MQTQSKWARTVTARSAQAAQRRLHIVTPIDTCDACAGTLASKRDGKRWHSTTSLPASTTAGMAKHGVQVLDWGVSNATLEDVFNDVAAAAVAEAAAEGGVGVGAV